MGVEIVRVPVGFMHPTDDNGDAIAGAHHEPLYDLDESSKTGYQLYENVTEGAPVSPAFGSLPELEAWLRTQGWAEDQIAFLVAEGHAPSFVTRL